MGIGSMIGLIIIIIGFIFMGFVIVSILGSKIKEIIMVGSNISFTIHYCGFYY